MPDLRREAALAGAGAALAFASVAVLFVLPYLARDVAYPLGWDSPFYVWRTAAVGFDGLERIGGLRPATPLLFNGLAALTGQGAFTIAAVGPALLAAVTGLAAAGLLRAALGIGWGWVPFVALIAWVGFGHPGMVREQPDNVLNAACVLGALAAAVSYARAGRGWLATAALLAAAGLAHWPFFVLALGVLGLGTALFAGRRMFASGVEARRARALLGAGAAAAGVVAGLALWRPPTAWTTPKLLELREILRDRFVRRVADAHRVPVLPVAGFGVAVASRRRDRPERRLFLWLMLAWIGLTVVGVVLQIAGVPTAGLRLLNNLFPLTLLAAAAVWWVAVRLSARFARAAGAALAVLALAGFGAMAVPFQLRGTPWYEPAAVEQIAAAGAWLEKHRPGVPAGFEIESSRDTLTTDRRRNTILAVLPPRVAATAELDPQAGGPARLLVLIRAYAPLAYREAVLEGSGTAIATGVVAVDDVPITEPPGAPGPGSRADTSARTILMMIVLGGLALGGAGLGWARVLLPGDAVLRWALAPALGCAATVLIGVAWAAVGLPLDEAAGAGPLALAAAAGSGAALVGRGRD